MKKTYLPMQVSQLGSLAELTQQGQGNPKSGPLSDGVNMRIPNPGGFDGSGNTMNMM